MSNITLAFKATGKLKRTAFKPFNKMAKMTKNVKPTEKTEEIEDPVEVISARDIERERMKLGNEGVWKIAKYLKAFNKNTGLMSV